MLKQLAIVVQGQAAIRFYDMALSNWQLSRVISAPNVAAFERVFWSPSGLNFAASNGNQLWFWDMSQRSDYQEIIDLETDLGENNNNPAIQRELEFYQNSSSNCAKIFEARITALTIQGMTVFVTLENGYLHEVYYNHKKRTFRTMRSVLLGEPSSSVKVSAVRVCNTDIVALTTSGVIFSACRHSAKVLSYQADVDCDEFITIPDVPVEMGTFIIPIGSNSVLKPELQYAELDFQNSEFLIHFRKFHEIFNFLIF